MAKTGNTAGEYAAIWDGARWVSIRGDKGDPGQLVIKGSVASPADLPATGTPGDVYLVSGNLYSWDDVATKWVDGGRIQGPQGPQGPSGAPGRDGIDGVSTTVRVGTVSEGPLSVTNTGTASQAVINFTIPKGDAGPAGPAGADGVVPTISIGTTSVLPSGSSATVTKTGTASNVVLSFGIPTGPAGSAGATGLKGDPGVAGPAGSVGPAGAAGAAGKDGAAGAAGKDGAAASLAIGTVSTLDAGKPATVSNSGTSSAAVINFGIPQGTQGLQGPAGADGAAATIAIGTVTSGTKAAVTNSGTSSAAIINFTVPKGDTGAAGADGKDGAGVTIKGTLTGAATALPTAVAGDMYLLGDPVPTAAPSPSVGTKVAGDGIVYNGTAWSNVGPIRGPAGPAGVAGAKGDAGPTEVSADAHNYSKLGTDNKLFTPTPAIPAAATAFPLVDGVAASVGVSLKYAREDHAHILPTLTALGAAASSHTHAAATEITGLSKVATTGKYTDLTDTPTAFVLPTASATVLGGVKVGTGLSISSGVLSASGTTSPDASTTVKGIVQLADAAAITAGTASRAVDAAHLKTSLDLKAPIDNPSFTGIVHLPLGAATMPSLAFTGDVDTGLYLQAANTPVIVAGGVESLVVTATGVSVAGNITSTGKAHTFEAGSIKRAAVEGIDQTTLDARYLNVTGDTMTGSLTTTAITANAGRSSFAPVNEQYAIGLKYNAAGLPNYIGTTSTGVFQVSEPGGSSILQVSRTGNITSPGTAHTFVAGSIARAAVAGLAETDLDTRYVNVTGDTMTGQLIVKPAVGPASPEGSVQVIGDGTNANITIQRNQDSGQPVLFFKKSRGTTAAPTAVHANDTIATIQSRAYGADGTYLTGGFINVACTKAPAAGDTGIASEWRFSAHDGKASAQVMTMAAAGVTIPNVTTTNATIATLTSDTLTVSRVATVNGPLTVNNKDTGTTLLLNVNIASTNSANQGYGSSAHIDLVTKTTAGFAVTNTGKGTVKNVGFQVDGTLPASAINWAFFSDSLASNYFRGNVGIGLLAPSVPLEVLGNSKLRGTLDVTGNITSTGTAHAFAAKSIPVSAINGVPADALPLAGGTLTGALTAPSVTITGNITSTGTAHSFVAKSIPVTALSAFPTVPTATPASQTATGVAGQMEWDANYLYLAVGANQWRRVPLMEWDGSGASGSGAGAKDEALSAPTTTVVSVMKSGGTPLGATVGKIIINMGTIFPALSTGVKFQYRTHGGNWIDATILQYSVGNVQVADWTAYKSAASGTRTLTIGGPPPNVPYITRVAWVSTLGTGLWSAEIEAVTPTT